MYCIDASVIVNAQRPNEPYSKQSKVFLNRVKKEKQKVFFPEIVIPEITSGLTRGTKKPKLAYEFSTALRRIPNFIFVPVDSYLADLASWVIFQTKLKGADAIYVALAFNYNLELITLDGDQLEKAKELINAHRPQ